MFMDQRHVAFGFLKANNVLIFMFFKHVEFSIKKAVVATKKRTAIPGNDSKTRFLVTPRCTREKSVKDTTRWHQLGQ